MRRLSICFFAAYNFLFCAALSAQGPKPPSDAVPAVAAPPKTVVEEVKETIHGTEIVDPYRWLEDQSSPQTRAWIDAENAYTDSLLSRVPGRDALRQEVAAVMKIDAMGQPVVRNGRYFFSKRRADQDQLVMYMRKGLNGTDELLVDPLALSPEHTITVGLNAVSRDGSLIVYALRQGGEDETTLHLFDVDARKDLADMFPRARYGAISILPDKSGLYYSKVTPEGPRMYFHKIGAGVDADVEIFGKGDAPEKSIRCDLSH